MLGIGGAKPVAGQAEEDVACPISLAYSFIGREFFQNYPKWFTTTNWEHNLNELSVFKKLHNSLLLC